MLFFPARVLCGMASCPQSVPVIREIQPPDPDQEADEDSNNADGAQQLMSTLGLPARSRQDSYR
jgi:hypothetical protein